MKYHAPSMLWAAFVLWLSLRPKSELPDIAIPHLDKAVHFIFYLVLALLMEYAWAKHEPDSFISRYRFFKIVFIATLYGYSIELLQEQLSVGRYFSWSDVAANALGAVSGVNVRLLSQSFRT